MARMDTTDARRILLAVGRNVGEEGDELDLAALAALRPVLEGAIATAVAGLRGRDLSWANLGDALGVTKAAVHKRYGTPVAR